MSLLLFIGYINLNAMDKELSHLTPEQQEFAATIALITPEYEYVHRILSGNLEEEVVNDHFENFGKIQGTIYAYKKPPCPQQKTCIFFHSNSSFFKNPFFTPKNIKPYVFIFYDSSFLQHTPSFLHGLTNRI